MYQGKNDKIKKVVHLKTISPKYQKYQSFLVTNSPSLT